MTSAAGDELQEILDALRSPVARDGVKLVVRLLKLRREGYRDRWEAGPDTESQVNLGKAKECRDLIKILCEE